MGKKGNAFHQFPDCAMNSSRDQRDCLDEVRGEMFLCFLLILCALLMITTGSVLNSMEPHFAVFLYLKH